MLVKAKVLGRARKGKVLLIKGRPPSQHKAHPNTMDIKFAWLEALVTSMVAHMKSTTSGLGKAKDKNMTNHMVQMLIFRIFCGVGF
jgi:cytochrome c oxidase assembly factor CtaG